MSGMNFLIGIRTDDYVILAADTNAFAYGAINVSDSKHFLLSQLKFNF